jgi:predicted unusual protein kinase regulating ubiquinone biosynthesis (AarF/ABC1/UbiB family)
MTKPYEQRGIAVPASRINRAARLGGMTTGIFGRMAADGARALLAGQRPDRRSLLLTPANAARLTDELARMRGAAMKMGQLLSMEAGDILPPELADTLSKLRADAHYMPPAQLKQVLITEYGPDFLKRFAKFETRPIAAASIGQVHRAITNDGRVLALKIQYPGVKAAINADVSNLGALMKVSGLLPRGIAIEPFMAEARRQLHEEADYAREAAELDRFGGLVEGMEAFVLPKVQRDFCTDTILAMDFIDSHPLESVEAADQDTRDRVATALFSLFLQEILIWRHVQTDPNFANFRWQPDTGRIVLLDFGAARGFPAPVAEHFRALLAAARTGDEAALRTRLVAFGLLPEAMPTGQDRIIGEMIALGLPMMRQKHVDFGDTTLLAAMRDKGMVLGMEEGFRHIPPWDVLYIQRKLAGLVLMATRLRARVPLGDLVAAAI